jgi:membrane protein implicated in regulation of membrane protease activity
MFISADDVITAITYLIPGFIALRVLYTFGFPSKRSDAEWAIWSLLGSAAIAPFTQAIAGLLGLTKSPATFADTVKSCAAPVLTGPEADRLTGVVSCATSALSKQLDSMYVLLIGVVLGLILGLLLLVGWRLVSQFLPRVAGKAVLTSWDRVMNRERQVWVEAFLSDDRHIRGRIAKASSDVETDTADVFIEQPSWIGDNREVLSMGDVLGVWLPRSEIKVLVLTKESGKKFDF